eukprot:GEMP01009457.1.p1 GENE.GEMP01009457.1~~GEMP01009457.1.p1  ORF type:complete len:350 (+),score=70.48 GEMP01009457.1:45-1052(+)
MASLLSLLMDIIPFSKKTNEPTLEDPSPLDGELPCATVLLLPPNDGQFVVTSQDLCPEVEFEPVEHVYHVGENRCISVTQLIEKFFEPFDADAIIDKYMDRWQNTTTSPYHGMTREEIKATWSAAPADSSERQSGVVTVKSTLEKQRKSAGFIDSAPREGASEQGTWMHAQIESYFRNEKPSLEELRLEDSVVFEQFCNFRQKEHLDRIYGIELRLGLEGLIAGTIDLVTLNPRTDKLTLYDWKRSKGPAIARNAPNYGKHGLRHPFQEMKDTKFVRYSIQLNLYRYMLERLTGKDVEAMYIVQMHPSLKDYNKVKAEFMDFSLEDLVEAVAGEI